MKKTKNLRRGKKKLELQARVVTTGIVKEDPETGENYIEQAIPMRMPEPKAKDEIGGRVVVEVRMHPKFITRVIKAIDPPRRETCWSMNIQEYIRFLVREHVDILEGRAIGDYVKVKRADYDQLLDVAERAICIAEKQAEQIEAGPASPAGG